MPEAVSSLGAAATRARLSATAAIFRKPFRDLAQTAAEIVPPASTSASAPARVLFYGVTGSGKSAAARTYAETTGLPEFSADDDVGWLPGWQQRTVEEQRGIAAAIAARDRWVLDSAYGVWRDVVLPRAELVVGLDYPRWLSLARLLRRSLRRARSRETVCNGNIETIARLIDHDSIILWHFRSFTRKRRVMRSLHRDPGMPPVILFRRPGDLDAWLAKLPPLAREDESL
jgi:adenylate kinase family enzyme